MSRSSRKFAAAITAVAALIATPALAASDSPSFVEDGVFSVCQDPTFPPMEFMSAEQKPVGVDVDVVSALAAHWGVEPKVMTMDFSGLLPSLSATRCDAVISGTLLTEERQKTFDGVGYLNTFIVIVAKKGAAPFASVEDLAGKTIAAQSGTKYVEELNQMSAALEAKGLSAINVQVYPKQTDAIQQLQVGRVDGVMTQDTEVAYREFENPGQFETVWTVPLETPQPYAAYIRPNGDDKAMLAKAIAALIADGTLKGIVETWKLSPSQLAGIGE